MRLKITFIFFIIISSLFVLTSCSKFLSQVPDNTLSDDSIFSSLKNTQEYLAQVYSNIPDPYSTRGNWTGHTIDFNMIADDGNILAQSGFGVNNFVNNTLSPALGAYSLLWSDYYKAIRTATDFINKIDGANPIEVSDFYKAHYKAEARAMRAIYYFWLIRLYGPVVLVPEPISVNSSTADLALQRTPLDSCINYIVDQLDSAYTELKVISTGSQPSSEPLNKEYGRVTTGVCKAYKEQVLLWAASPLFNGNPAYTSLKNPDGTPLFPQTYDKNKWKTAAEAAKDFIDEFVPTTYDLFTESDADPYMAAYKACRDVTSTDWNKEWIFGRSMSGNISFHNYNCTPKLVGYTNITAGGGFAAANQSLVDAFFMKNGLPISNESSGYVKTGFSMYQSPADIKQRSVFNQWVNREPRFYVNVTYSSSYWINQGSSPTEVVVNFENKGNSGYSQSPGGDYSMTGYLQRKDVTQSTSSRGACFLRLAQIYLDYSEALNEYDPGNSDILKFLNFVRQRAGIPQYGSGADMIPPPSTQSAVREAIHHERQVELAFEGNRYYDLRRWLNAITELNKPIMGMNITGNGNDFYNVTFAHNSSFTLRSYLFAIPQNEILKDSKLVQNPGF